MKFKKIVIFVTSLISLSLVSTAIGLSISKLDNNTVQKVTNSINDDNQVNKITQIQTNLKPIVDYVQKQPIQLFAKSSDQDAKYQWFMNNKPIVDWNNITGVNTSNLTINNPSSDLNGSTIYCEITTDSLSQNTILSTLQLLNNFELSQVLVTSDIDTNAIPNQGNFTLQALTNINPIYDSYLTYQWYLNNKLIDNSNNQTLSITNANSSNAGSYTCIVSLNWNNKVVSKVESNKVDINVLPGNDFELGIGFKSDTAKNFPSSSNPYIFVNQGDNFNLFVVPTEDNQFFIPGDNEISYQWYKDGVKLTTSKDMQGVDEEILMANNVNYLDSGMYYCVATYHLKTGETFSTQTIPVYLSVKQNDHIDVCENINDITVKQGESASFKVQASYDEKLSNFIYQWYYQQPNTSQWVEMQNQNNQELDIAPDQVNSFSGYKFVCDIKYNSPDSKVHLQTHSNIATLNVVPTEINILSQPMNVENALIGQNVSFSTNAISTDYLETSDLQYQWVQVINSNTVEILPNQNKPTLTLNNVQYSDNGNQYTCHIYFNNPALAKQGMYTNIVKLNVLKPTLNPNITIQTKNTINVGQPETLKVLPTSNYENLPQGYKYTYQWFNSKNNKGFNEIDNSNTNSLVLKPFNDVEDDYYKCEINIIDNANNVVNSITTPVFSLNVVSNINVNVKIKDNFNFIQDSNATITPIISVKNDPTNLMDNAHYQWQISDNNENWTNLENQNNKDLNIKNISENYNNKYLRLVVNVANHQFISNSTKISVSYLISKVVTDKTEIKANIATNNSISVNVFDKDGHNITDSNQIKYQWFVKYNDKVEQILNANKSSLTLNNIQSNWNNAQFYCEVIEENGDKVDSDNVTLTINPVTINYHENQKVLDLSKTNVWDLEIDNVKPSYTIPNAKLQFQWETYNPVTHSWISLNEHNEILDLHDLKHLINNEEFRCIITYQDDNNVYAKVITENQKILVASSTNPSTPIGPNNPGNGDNQNPNNKPNHPSIPSSPSNPNGPSNGTNPPNDGSVNNPSNGTNNPHTPNTPHEPNNPTIGNNKSSSNAWIAMPIVFGSILAISMLTGLVYWFMNYKKVY